MKSEFGENITFYADYQRSEHRRTALNIQCVESRDGALTLALELAPIAKRGDAPQWKEKITLHLSPDELTALCSVALGCRSEMEAAFHGEGRNKGVQLRSKAGEGALITLSEAGRNMQFILSSDNRMALCAFALRRQSQAWKVSVPAVIEIIRACDQVKI